MARKLFSAGSPVIIALVIVSIASAGARYYHDHHLVQQTQAQIAVQSVR
jgi:hypothetical protein